MPDPIKWDHCMTVGQLRAELTQHPDDMIVVLAKDGEGNAHSPLSGTERLVYVPESNWAGEVCDLEDDGVWPDGRIVLVLGPVN
jgi:hypothetical protein